MTDEQKALGASAVKQYHKAVFKVATAFHRSRHCPPDLELDDITQELFTHLYKKFHKYDPALGVKPLTYAIVILKRHVTNTLARHCRRGFASLPENKTADGKRCKLYNVQPASYQDTVSRSGRTTSAGTYLQSVVWTEAEWNRVLARIRHPRWRDAARLVFKDGLTIGDVARLMAEDRDRVAGYVRSALICLRVKAHLYNGDDFPADTHASLEELERSSTQWGDDFGDASPVKHLKQLTLLEACHVEG